MSDSDGAPAKHAGGVGIRVAGIDVHLPLSGILGVGIIAWLWASNFSTATSNGLLLAVIFAVLVYVGIALHEFAHAFVARAFGYPVHGITLWILGGFTVYQRRSARPGPEALIAVAGPVVTLLLAGIAYLAEQAFVTAGMASAARVAAALVWTNVLLGVMNLLPGIPLDGGTILKSAIWGATGSESAGTTVAAWSGRALAVALVLVGAHAAFAGGGSDLTILLVGLVLGWFLWSGATNALKRSEFEARLPGISLRDLSRRAVGVPAGVMVAEALRRRGAAEASAIVVLGGDGTPIGIASVESMAAIPPERLAWVPVSSVSRALEEGSRLPIDMAPDALLEAVQDHPRESYLVVDADGLVYGVLQATDLAAALQ